jgi:hypothetical protein
MAMKNKALEFRDAAMRRRDKAIVEGDNVLARNREALESRDVVVFERENVAQELRGCKANSTNCKGVSYVIKLKSDEWPPNLLRCHGSEIQPSL